MTTESLTDDIELMSSQFTLPRDFFRSRFTYALYDLKTLSWLSLVSIILVFALFELMIVSTNFVMMVFTNPFVNWAAVLFFFLLIRAIIFRCARKKTAVIKSDVNAVHFLQKIQDDHPGCLLESWDGIAAHMNTFLYESSAYAVPYYFYNGEVCFASFRNSFVLPYYHEEKAETGIIKSAINSYQNSLDEEWRECQDVISSPAEGMKVMLPCNQFRNKFSYNLKASKGILTAQIVFFGIDALFHVFLYCLGLRWNSFILSWSFDVQMVSYMYLLWFVDHKSRSSVMNCFNRMAFLKAFMRHRNENVSQRWDHIAEDMNEILSTYNPRPSPYFFYDGAACNAYFKRIFSLEPKKATFMSRFKSLAKNAYPELNPYMQEVKNILEKENI